MSIICCFRNNCKINHHSYHQGQRYYRRLPVEGDFHLIRPFGIFGQAKQFVTKFDPGNGDAGFHRLFNQVGLNTSAPAPGVPIIPLFEPIHGERAPMSLSLRTFSA